MHVEELLKALKSVMSKDRCVEFLYYPRRDEVVARVDLDEGMSGRELFAIYETLEGLGFSSFWIDEGVCDLLEDRYSAPEIMFYAKDVSRDLVEFLKNRGNRFIVCSG